MRTEYSERTLFNKFTYGEDFSEVSSEENVLENEIEEETTGNVPVDHHVELAYSQEYLDKTVSVAVKMANAKILEEISKNQEEEINCIVRKINEKIYKSNKFFLSQMQMYSESISRSLFDSFFATYPVAEEVVAADVVAGICRKVLPLLENSFKVTVNINSLTFDEIMERDETLKIFQFPWIIVEKSAILGRSDIEITWPDGCLTRNLESISKDILMYIADEAEK
ncbi:hypothetical protein HK28_01475 [Acetobacter sp. DsW_063]|nr:hypothetical protein HK28_01475 [Acetobacter sp. DsW_063]